MIYSQPKRPALSRIWRGQVYGPTRRCVITYTEPTKAKMIDRLSVL